MSIAIVITKLFPFGNDTGEMYLREEILVLQNRFDSVVIIACDACEGQTVTAYDIAENVTVMPLQNVSTSSKLRYIPLAVRRLFIQPEPFVHEERHNNTFVKNLFLAYFLAKCDERLFKIAQKYADFFNVEEETYIYSYRLFDGAFVALNLKYSLPNVVQTVSRAHGYDLYENSNALCYLPLRKYFTNTLDVIFPCSKHGKRYIDTEYPNHKCEVKCAYLGSPDNGLGPSTDVGTLRLVSCSNVNSVKRVELIARCIALASLICDVNWVHIGDGPQLKHIRRRYRTFVNDGRFQFTGRLPKEEVTGLFRERAFDLFINLSSSEGVPQAIMEALSFGIPCLASDVGGTSEIVMDGITGFLVNRNAADIEIASIIGGYSQTSPQIRQCLRQNARRFWENNFNATHNAELFCDALFGMSAAQ